MRSDSTQRATSDSQCKNCTKTVPFHHVDCPYCGEQYGYPNIRAAEKVSEIKELNRRYEAAIEGCKFDAIKKFYKKIDEDADIVMCRSFPETISLLETNRIFQTFHNNVAIGARIAEDNKWDAIRGSVGAALFPEYFPKINYAVLSLNSMADSYYGGYSLTIDTVAIKKRTSFFQEDSVAFFQKNVLGYKEDSVPAGYRASWESKAKLAVAKLASKINEDTKEEEFAAMLVTQSSDGQIGDYIEAHIHGGVMGTSIKKIIKHKSNTDKAETTLIKKQLRKLKNAKVHIQYGEEG